MTKAEEKPRLPFKTTKQLVEVILDLAYFEGSKPAIPYVWVPGKGRLIVVVGENGGGKSFFRRLICLVGRENEVEPINVSMEGRREVAYNIGLVFVYGDESYEATGINSIRTVTSGITTCQKRDKPHLIVWDEPDLGLSESNAASVGKVIADFAADPPDLTRAVVVMTHRKALVSQLLAVQPHYLFLGDADGPPNLQAWLDAPMAIRSLDDVQQVSRRRFQAIQKILNRAKSR